jgi:hypothetical protein
MSELFSKSAFLITWVNFVENAKFYKWYVIPSNCSLNTKQTFLMHEYFYT